MSIIEPYQEIVKKSYTVSEPMIAYGAMEYNVEDYLKAIPEETMRKHPIAF